MLGWIAKCVLVLTAFAPVAVTYAFTLWRRGQAVAHVTALLGASAVLVALCLMVLRLARQRIPPIAPFTITALRPADTELVAFVLAYLFPLVGLGARDLDVVVLAFVVVVLGLVVGATHAYHFNPLLALFGYHFYEVESADGVTFILLSRRDLRRAKEVKTVRQLTDYVVLDSDGELSAR